MPRDGFESSSTQLGTKSSANAGLFCFVADYVYIIQSEADGSYYKGYSEAPSDRLLQHNAGWSSYTRNKVPWQLVYVERLDSRREALIRERVLKKYSHAQIAQLIASSKNVLQAYLESGD